MMTRGNVAAFALPMTLFIAVSTHGQHVDYYEIENEVMRNILQYSSHIENECATFQIDPRLIVAILYVEKTQYVLDNWLRIRNRIELATTELLLLFQSVYHWADLSTGYCRIKPSFAEETRARLVEFGMPEYLSVEETNPEVYSIDPVVSIKIMCASLFVFREQWRRAGFEIGTSFGILATLYNLGYSRSVPHANPRNGGSNYPVVMNGALFGPMSFGDRVDLIIAEQSMNRVLLRLEWIH